MKLEDSLTTWPHHFEEQTPKLNLKSIKQVLVFSFVINFVEDKNLGKLDYLKFKSKRGSAHPLEVFLDFNKVITKDNFSIFKCPKATEDKEAKSEDKIIDLEEFFEAKPDTLIRAFSMAIDIFSTHYMKQDVQKIILKIENFQGQVTLIDKIDKRKIGKFVKVRGKVVTLKEPKLYIKSMVSQF